MQPDGKILVGGSFLSLGGWPRHGLGRLTSYGNVDTGFDPSTDGSVASLFVQADGRVLIGGSFTTIAGLPCTNLARFNRDGSLDLSFAPAPDGAVNALACQADGSIIVGGLFQHLGGQPRAYLGRLKPDGTLDEGFTIVTDATVGSLAMQPDGKILVGGGFGHLGGLVRQGIGRLNADGTVDATFILGTDNGWVGSLAVEPDGKILAGGFFTTMGGHSRTNLGRLYPDGSMDTSVTQGWNSFDSLVLQPDGKVLLGATARLNPDGSTDSTFSPGVAQTYAVSVVQPDRTILVANSSLSRLRADGSLDLGFNVSVGSQQESFSWVYALGLQPDGRILAGGVFLTLNGEPRSFIGRLNANGTLDETFNPGADSQVKNLVVQPDGKILVSGNFNVLTGQVRPGFGRLEADGRLDASFTPAFAFGVVCFLTQPDGQILVGGDLVTPGGARGGVARLRVNGSQDPNFGLRVVGDVYCLALQADGKILVGGVIMGPSLTNLARLNPDGSFDTSFAGDIKYAADPSSGGLLSLAAQTDGKVLVQGNFDLVNGLSRYGLARVSSKSAALQALLLDDAGTVLTWQRGGSAPEVEQVTFEVSMDTTNYAMLGAAARISGGWQLPGLALPVGESFYVRARGRCVASGQYGSYGSLIESVAQFYRIVPPRLSALPPASPAPFQFAFTNPSLASFTVLAATNVSTPLSNWTAVGSPWPIGGALYQFTDPGVSNHPQRFYQLHWP